MANNSGTPGRRTQLEFERTRQRILDRSERLFARRGFGGVSLRELAAESEVQHRTIHHHFGSKLPLYQAVGGLELDLGLLLISVEGMLNNHVLARSHYEELHGADVTDPKLKRRTKEHLKTILCAVLGAD